MGKPISIYSYQTWKPLLHLLRLTLSLPRVRFRRYRHPPPADDPEREIIIAVMGPSGAGKSYFIKEVSGIEVSDVKVGGNPHSYTSKVQPYSFQYAGAKITLVDTPGFGNTTKSDTEVLADICAWRLLSYKEKRLLSGIIYLHRITDVHLDSPPQKNLGMFERFCGPSVLQNVLLTTTQWSNIDHMLGWQREEDLRRQDFWGGLISKGASLERFMNTRESGLELIYKLMKKEPKPLHIQDQIVEKGMALVETDAGRFINDELISLQKKYAKDLGTLERERQNAVTEKDDEMEKILAQAQAKAQERLEKAAADRGLLADLSEAKMKKREEAEAAERMRAEERDKEDKAVIAVALNDISFGAQITSLFKPYTTKGRLIYDMNDPGEFEKASFDITINYQSNVSFINVWAKTLAGFTDGGVDTNDYIVHNEALYWPKSGGPVTRGTQKFRIFTRVHLSGCEP
ncbi:hypothetical protein B9Z19DRAFT_994853 [Tuber borchii]|uniref:G domain-containing protein n=1 Tax=Tuber borchii TaxID=42251 RepID=A0A2T6ZIV8_TUBBO|nr:hypothetical protein B9Z19DRAFT_994853 [Tuber borchii]